MAIELLIEYTVDDDKAGEADRVRQAFLDGVRAWRDGGFRYRMLRKGDDGRTFVHLAWLEDAEAQKRLGEQDFFREFAEGMKRVSGGTVTATRLTEIGSTE